MISPVRLVKLGLSVDEVAAFLGLTPEDVDAELAQAEERRQPPPPAGRTLMTPLLLRPELDRWQMRNY